MPERHDYEQQLEESYNRTASECPRCTGGGIILVGSWGQYAENCPECGGTGQRY